MCRPRVVLLLALAMMLGGCASFPPVAGDARFDDGLDAAAIIAGCMDAHGGDMRDYPGDLNLSTDGQWYQAIQRIQPWTETAEIGLYSALFLLTLAFFPVAA